jgi:aminoglycoside phosphotransferase (APT) family kinase protein
MIEAVREQFPALAALPVRPLGEGTDFRAFAVGPHVFRFPKSDEAAAALAVEARLTAFVAPRLPLAVPVYRFTGRPSASFSRPFAGYDRLPGRPALGRALDVAAVGRVVGDFLRRLHALDAPPGVPDEDDPALAAWSRDTLADLRPSEAAWAPVVAAPPAPAAARCLVHGDFAAEHVLLDDDGAPTGVIDWSDAMVGDPALDLAGLLHWGGEAMLAAALETYGAVDAATRGRARWFALCRAVADIAFGEDEGRPEYVAAGRRALRHVAVVAGVPWP